mgnify:CR=1 FL=1
MINMKTIKDYFRIPNFKMINMKTIKDYKRELIEIEKSKP